MSGGAGRTPRFPLRLDKVGPARPGPAPVLRPQAPVQQAHADAARRSAPSGLGLDSDDVRRRMVARLQREGITHAAVLAAFAAVPRHAFVDAALVTQAYEDTSLPIGHGQTISKPSVVGRMLDLLHGGANARALGQLGGVLEIGTGCGYQAALLAQQARRVVSIERVRALHDKARELLGPLRLDRVRLVYGDGMQGHAPNAPYDSIIAAAGGEALPQPWLDQLAVGGRLVAPVARPGQHEQVLVVVDRHEHGYAHRVHETVKFVPLKSGRSG